MKKLLLAYKALASYSLWGSLAPESLIQEPRLGWLVINLNSPLKPDQQSLIWP